MPFPGERPNVRLEIPDLDGAICAARNDLFPVKLGQKGSDYMSGWKQTLVTSSLWPRKDLATDGSWEMEKFCIAMFEL